MRQQIKIQLFSSGRRFLPLLMIASLLLNLFSFSTPDSKVRVKGFAFSSASPVSQSAENIPTGESSEEMETELGDDDFDHVMNESLDHYIELKVYTLFGYQFCLSDTVWDIPTPPPANHA
ncbi:MAG: hypothetical protein ACOZCO_04730 [Bacteroidota bacterium]